MTVLHKSSLYLHVATSVWGQCRVTEEAVWRCLQRAGLLKVDTESSKEDTGGPR